MAGEGLELKPWKVKKKQGKKGDDAEDIVEIFESKVVTPIVHDIEVTSPETGYLCIRCQGDAVFHIPSHVVDCFQCVDIIFHGDGELVSISPLHAHAQQCMVSNPESCDIILAAVFKENLEKMIRFPDIRPEVRNTPTLMSDRGLSSRFLGRSKLMD